jgi:hypothetical protein
MTTCQRRYALRKTYLRAQPAIGAVFVGFWVLLIAEHAGVVFLLIAAGATVFTIWQDAELLRNSGVRETPDGIANRQMFGDSRWRWDEIEKFTNASSRVYVLTRNRSASRLSGIAEGSRNLWEDGETRNITALLNDRLALWQTKEGVCGTSDTAH